VPGGASAPNDALALLLFLLAVPVFTLFILAAVCAALAPPRV
jgi:hypothetical protein